MSIHSISCFAVHVWNRRLARFRGGLLLNYLLFSHLLFSSQVLAQIDLDRPADSRPDLPAFQDSRSERVLPSVVLPEQGSVAGVSAGRTVVISEFAFRGNQVFSDAQLNTLVEGFRGKALSFVDIEQLRRSITEAYILAGYVNSGALVPDQSIANATLIIDIVEGRLTQVHAAPSGAMSVGALEKRLLRSGKKLNVNRLEEALQLLQQDPRVAEVNARLSPGERPGDARLDIDIDQAKPWAAVINLSNHEPAAVGEGALRAGFQHYNVFGFNDELYVNATRSQGLVKGDASYVLPLNSYGTAVSLRWSESHSEVVLGGLDDLDIESESTTFSLELSQYLWQNRQSSFELFLRAESRRNFSSVLDQGFSFTPGPDAGLSRVRVVRLGQDYIHRGKRQVFALRTTVSQGFDVDNATINASDVPDGEFVSVLMQLQLARKLEFLQSRLIGRIDSQWADSPLLGMEQFAIGGVRTVRGYTQNSLVADSGAIAAIEWRVPVWRSGDGRSVIEVAPFVDYGRAWNEGRDDPAPDSLFSAGAGLLGTIGKRYRFAAWYGEALEDDAGDIIGSSLQEDGFHLSFTTFLP